MRKRIVIRQSCCDRLTKAIDAYIRKADNNLSDQLGKEGYQVGIYAKLADGDETLLIIMQDDRGVEIPSHTENSDFEIELYGIMAISNVANISVTVDPNAVASVAMKQSRWAAGERASS